MDVGLQYHFSGVKWRENMVNEQQGVENEKEKPNPTDHASLFLNLAISMMMRQKL